MYLYVCDAGGVTFAVSYADVGDASAVEPALAALRRSSAANIESRDARDLAYAVPGMAPASGAGRALYNGRLPSGATTELSAAYFVEGTRVYQATMMAPSLDAEAVETFYRGLRLGAGR